MHKTAIVTGGTSGIGAAAAKTLAQKYGYTVYVFSRHDYTSELVKHIKCDVSKEEEAIEAVNQVLAEAGELDLVINCAGMGISGAIEYTELDDARRQFDINFFGMVNINKACMAHLRKTKGRIVNISSVAAAVPIPFQSYYSASKAAINSYSLALANELKPFGVSVCAVMPGDTATGFTAARSKSNLGDDIYQGRIRRSVSKMEKDEQSGMTAQKAGEIIASVALRNRLPYLYTIGISYKLVSFLMKILPVNLSQKLIFQLYAR